MIKISAILLGAGESKRMGVNKLSLPWGKETVFKHCFNVLLRSRVNEVIVVLGKQSRGMRRQLEKESADLTKKIIVTLNPHYKRGISTSIRRGLRVMDPRSVGILISLGDQPFLKTRTIDALIRAFDRGEGEILVPSYRGRKGHPVIFHRKYEEELVRLRGDTGGRSILQKYRGKVKRFRVRSEGVTEDIDTKEEYKKALRRRGRDEKSDSGKVGKRTR